MGPPFLPPLKFDFEDTASSGFDLGDMLGSDTTTTSKESGSKDKEKEKTIIIETPSSPISPRDSDLAKAQEKSTYRVSIGRASPRLSASSADTSEQSSLNNDGTRPSSESPEPNGGLRSLSAKGSQSQLTVDSIPHSRSSQDQSEVHISPFFTVCSFNSVQGTKHTNVDVYFVTTHYFLSMIP